MRRLMWFTLGFAGSCALCAYWLGESLRIPGMVLGLLGTLGLWMTARRFSFLSPGAVVMLGCTVGLIWFVQFDRLYLEPAAALDGQTLPLTLRASDFGQESDYGVSVDGTVTLQGRIYRARVYLDTDRSISPGDRMSGRFRCRVTTSDGEQEATFHQGKGVFLLLYQSGDSLAFHPGERTWRDAPARLRQQILNDLQTWFPEDTAPFAKALLLGDTSGLGYETDTELKISGIRHVAAVSGLHVSILFALVSTLSFRKKYLTALLGLPSLLVFAAVAGFTPSVTRACLMSALMLLAPLLRRSYDGATSLAFASLIILGMNPLAVTNAGFQLSVASVAGIYLFSSDLHRWIASLFGSFHGKTLKGRLIHWMAGSISVSLSAMTLTVPLCAWYFGTVSLIGPVTNLLTLWVISLIFYGLIALCLLALVWSGAAGILAAGLSVPIRYVLYVAKTMAGLPMAAIYTRSGYIVIWLVFVYVLLAVFLAGKHRKPWYFAGCATLGLCVALLASWAEPLLDEVRLTVLDVGQGQCLILQSRGKTFLVDCGGDRDEDAADAAAEELLSQGISRLDGMILTHMDRDHAGGAAYLLSRVDTQLLILPPEPSQLSNPGGKTVYGAEDLTLMYEDVCLTVFHAPYEGDANEKSLCVLFDTKKCDILITSDRDASGEEWLIQDSRITGVDVLIAGHHGSKHSTSQALLEKTRPEIVCISVGRDNSYGHPAKEVLDRLEQFGCAVYRTDRNGDIRIRR